MASFTGVGDNTILTVKDVGEEVAIAISGTYDMTILFQREQGSPGSGSWETLKTYSTANATVADTYTTQRFDEKLRLFVSVDTSGTATATLTDGNKTTRTWKDGVGNTVMEATQDGVRFPLGVVAQQMEIVTLDAATYALDRDTHAGKLLVLDRSGGIDIDLPDATGSGDVYHFVVNTATADAYEISAFDVGDDDVFGVICGVDGDAEFTWGAASGDNTVTLGGTSQATGGSVGDYLTFIDFAAGKYHVSGFIHQGGTEATPFSTDI